MCKFVKSICSQLKYMLEEHLSAVALLVIRVYMAQAFFLSGLTKIKNWDSTLFLFKYEYSNVPVLPYEVAAYAATAGELILPVLLFAGFLTRISAFGLLKMTIVIELFVYPGTTEHYYWMMLLSILLTIGGGKLALDRVAKIFKS